MRTRSKIWTFGFTGMALAVAVVALFVVPVIRKPSAVAHSPAIATVKPAPQGAETQYRPIAPADVLGIGQPWAPLTGDGSN